MTISRRNALAGFLFIAPFLVGFAVFFLVPVIQSVVFIFQDVTFAAEGGGFDSPWYGLGNLNYIFNEDPDYKKALAGSLGQVAYQVPVVLIASLFLAIILNQKFRGRTVVRAIFFLPVIITSGVVMSVIQGDVFASTLISSSEGMTTSISPTSFGLQELLIRTGLSSEIVEYFTSISSNLFDLLWRTGIQMIIFLAGLQSIPGALYEASSIEGASAWENFWMITFPMLIPMMMVNLVYTIVDTFTDSTNEVMMMATNTGISGKLGRASAMNWTYFLVVAAVLGIVAAIYVRAGRRGRKSGR